METQQLLVNELSVSRQAANDHEAGEIIAQAWLDRSHQLMASPDISS